MAKAGGGSVTSLGSASSVVTSIAKLEAPTMLSRVIAAPAAAAVAVSAVAAAVPKASPDVPSDVHPCATALAVVAAAVVAACEEEVLAMVWNDMSAKSAAWACEDTSRM